jgi:oligopeptide/dipeptide ABC transporter ATP-binding protein
MALLELNNLSIDIRRKKKYYTAVNRIDLKIDTGEIIALSGESGCGKSLTALSIPGLLPSKAKITSGEIIYTSQNGILNLCNMSEDALCKIRGKEIAMIFQEPGQSLNPLMKIGKQIAEALELHGTGKKTAYIAALDMLKRLRFVQAEKVFNAWPHQLSGGMCQRVMIAIAAICRPRLLIADEPVTSLDTENQNHIMSLLKQINHEFGTAILFISHDISLVQHFCGRFLVMYAGHIIEEGPSDLILTAAGGSLESLHPYTAGLIGAVPHRKNRGRLLANIPGKAPSLEDKLSGCPFAPRCLKAKEKCYTELPPWKDTGKGHKLRCFFTEGGNG